MHADMLQRNLPKDRMKAYQMVKIMNGTAWSPVTQCGWMSKLSALFAWSFLRLTQSFHVATAVFAVPALRSLRIRSLVLGSGEAQTLARFAQFAAEELTIPFEFLIRFI